MESKQAVSKKHAAPIIAAILLLLPVLYVGSYLALVTPNARVRSVTGLEHYRIKGRVWSTVFWPLERCDRRLRPVVWDDSEWEPFL
jgi:hypothetical protein